MEVMGTARDKALPGTRHCLGQGTAQDKARYGSRHDMGQGTVWVKARYGSRHGMGQGIARDKARYEARHCPGKGHGTGHGSRHGTRDEARQICRRANIADIAAPLTKRRQRLSGIHRWRAGKFDERYDVIMQVMDLSTLSAYSSSLPACRAHTGPPRSGCRHYGTSFGWPTK